MMRQRIGVAGAAGLLLGAACLTGCGGPQRNTSRNLARDEATIAITPAFGPIEGRQVVGLPIPIAGTENAVVPLTIVTNKARFERDDPYDRAGFDGVQRNNDESMWYNTRADARDVRWHNAFIRNLRTGTETPVLRTRGVISRWAVFTAPDRPQRAMSASGLAFIATLDDTNRDGLLDDRDARVAILADAAWSNPRVVTPPNAQVWNIGYLDNLDNAVFLVVTDSNRDGRYTEVDEAVPYTVSITGAEAARPIVNPESLATARALLR